MAIKNKIILPLYMVIIWSIAKIYKSYIVINYQVNPTAFSLFALFTASVILILHGKTNKRMVELAFKEKHSWIFAIFDILSNITLIIMFYYVGSTRSSYLGQLCTVTVIGYNYIKHKREILFFEVFAILLILSGMFYALSEANPEDLTILINCTILSAIFLTGKTISAERNPLNIKIMDYQSRMKIAGIAVALSTVFMTMLIVALKISKQYIITDNTIINYLFNTVPDIEDFLYLPTIISAFLYGTILLVTSRYIYFKASKVSSAETLLTVAALSPLGTLILESIAYKLGLFSSTEINSYDVYICILISIGVVMLTVSRNKSLFSNHDKKIKDVFHKDKAS